MFIITRHGSYCLTTRFTGSSLLGMVFIVSLPSLVHRYWAWFVLCHLTLHWVCFTGHGLYCFTHWFIITGHCLYYCNSRFTGSSLLGMVYIVSSHASLVLFYWACYIYVHFPHWFIITGHDLYCCTSLTGTSLLVMVCIVSLHASLVLHYWAWLVLIHVMLHLFILTGNDLYCFTSLTGGSLLGMVCIVRLPSLVHRY